VDEKSDVCDVAVASVAVPMELQGVFPSQDALYAALRVLAGQGRRWCEARSNREQNAQMQCVQRLLFALFVVCVFVSSLWHVHVVSFMSMRGFRMMVGL
jgi:hypothetical protein